MVAGSIEERIKKMKQAILTEAKQRASTIVQNANEEADQQRTKIYNVEKQKITEQFSHLSKIEKVKAKIEKSAVINRQRIVKMQARYQLVERLKSEVHDRLRKVMSNESVYRQLLKNLITQGMLRLLERNISIELKSEHFGLAKKLFGECQENFSKIILQETGREMESKLSLSDYQLQEKNKNILGGVYLRSSDGLIICDNSIDSRVKLIFEQLLPSIRSLLFPKSEVKEP